MKRTNNKFNITSHIPSKTFWTVVWFVVFGISAVIWHSETNPDDGPGDVSDAPSLAGPLPGVASALKTQIVDPLLSTESQFGVPRIPHRPIEDPRNTSMCHFYKALSDVDNADTKSVARVLHYGDSILTSGELSGVTRRILQKRFGDGGHGFVLLGKPWRWYHHLDVKHGAKGDWFPRPLTSAPVRDGMFGLGGVAFETRAYNAKAWVGTVPSGPVGTKVASFDVSYLAQPHGGSFDLILNGKVLETISTVASTKRTIHKRINVAPGRAKLEVRTTGNGKVRIFGAVLESGEKGLVYDSLAINGARASNLMRFNEEHWMSEIKYRQADLVVLMFGANEGHNKYLSLDEYRTRLSSVLKTIRAGAPDSGCLVVGPLDQAKRGENGKLASRRMPIKLSEAQREISFEHGCAFFDTIEAMGGKGSMAKWRRNGFGGGDLIHPTEHGARQIGTWLADSLLAGYEDYLFSGEKCASSVTSL